MVAGTSPMLSPPEITRWLNEVTQEVAGSPVEQIRIGVFCE